VLEAVYDDLGDLRYALPELMRRLTAHPLAHQPGEGWRYGLSHAVLGRIIEVAAGQPLDEYFATAIFTPLGMVDSGFFVPPDKVGRLAAVYESGDGVLRRVDDPDTNQIAEHTPMLSGGGGCASMALDYLRFTRMLLRSGELDGVRLLKPETVALMTRNHLASPLAPIRIDDHVFEGEGYGLGFGVSLQPSAPGLPGSVGTYGWAGSWGTRFWVDPTKELSGIFMVQYQPFAFVSVGEEFWSLVCQALTD
jgi:CubicO group peptidase (beta-lactamase class C family)